VLFIVHEENKLNRLALVLTLAFTPPLLAADDIDFTRDIRPILSNRCFACHGPDQNKRKGGIKSKGRLRLDTQDGATTNHDDFYAIVPGNVAKSEVIERVLTNDEDDRMPPKGKGRKLTAKEVDLLKRWIKAGAPYAKHWSYTKVVRPAEPKVKNAKWVRNPIDRFVLERLEAKGLKPSPEADRQALARRAALDITGLPPTLAQVAAFVADKSPTAYEKYVDTLLASSGYGERWGRLWLDLARYADSSGYADDPPRTIWAYRDWVIGAINANMPYDQFTIEQIAGDLLPGATDSQRQATAFHRNTMTNSEGGTNDEEFRSVAVVDRVNTTMQIWMGTTINCAQCHTHKYDPITQEEYFKFYAILNQTADADRKNESPTMKVASGGAAKQRAAWETQIATLRKQIESTAAAKRSAGQVTWEASLQKSVRWIKVKPTKVVGEQSKFAIGAHGTITPSGAASKKDETYTLTLKPGIKKLVALQLETLGRGRDKGGNLVISSITASLMPTGKSSPTGRFVRVELPGNKKMISVAELQIFSGGKNIARTGKAKQSSTGFGGDAKRGIDGNTNGDFNKKSVTHTAVSKDPWFEVDLGRNAPIDKIVLWSRTGAGLPQRLAGYKLHILDAKRGNVWSAAKTAIPNPSSSFTTGGARPIPFATASADFSQKGFGVDNLIRNKDPKKLGWAIAPQFDKPHKVTLATSSPIDVTGGTLTIRISHSPAYPTLKLGRFRISLSDDPNAATAGSIPSQIVTISKISSAKRTSAQVKAIAAYYASTASEFQPTRNKIAVLQKQIAGLKSKGSTTLPIMQELAANKQRKTFIQLRGNFLDTGKQVTAGLPAVFPPLPAGESANRLGLAKWLVSRDNPLTARVAANRYWEQLFGIGIVRTSEEFGNQGELPSHPQLLDWMAADLMENGWDIKRLIKQITTSATYRQSSRMTAAQIELDPANRFVARGPRFRLSAEMIRDQALFVSGLLSRKMYGPSVNPPRPRLGLKAAFGGSTDWNTSKGEDKFRRGLYTNWRRSRPYPSMDTFDAPSREVCVVRRISTNTPLQALVTMNDPVYVEASQALARRMVTEGGKTPGSRIDYGFRLCLLRSPSAAEKASLQKLYTRARARYATDAAAAKQMATEPLGALPAGMNAIDLAAWTVVGNVLINLDEMFMKR
jgi:hypothetical protein